MTLSERVKTLQPSPTLALAAKAKALAAEGRDLVAFTAGEPDFDTPAEIVEAAVRALREGKTRYTPSGGIPELRRAVAAMINRDRGLSWSEKNVHIASGAKQALYHLFQALLDPGDEVIVPTPYWVSYPEQIHLAGGVPVFVPTRPEDGYKLTPEALERAIGPRTKAFVLNSPSNPTGAMYTEEELFGLFSVLVHRPVWIIADEIYERLVYDGAHKSIIAVDPQAVERTVIVSGVSKTYAMTGWRIGWAAAADERLIRALDDLASQSTSNPTTFAQYGALAAVTMDPAPVAAMVEAFRRRRDLIVERIAGVPGLRAFRPSGAFYLWVDVREAMERQGFPDADRWAAALLEEAGVVVVPGSGFGDAGHVRLSFALGEAAIEEGVRRLAAFVGRRREV
ncbi:MAG: pyridoxal phosphate-dependent aminotransferase [Hydrogenibacillus schlegelii]|uniref:Aminotransferase n=1 Tax=Hydrogenibacillus schlegelii TaxID=1484 RepID=A0A947D6H7_HYDSH|nr:pyridoxal phosphate-dependent aminotransferase [Hydrogenibacillus schlegelii]